MVRIENGPREGVWREPLQEGEIFLAFIPAAVFYVAWMIKVNSPSLMRL